MALTSWTSRDKSPRMSKERDTYQAMQLMEYTQFCIIPVPIRKGDRLMPYSFQRIFRNANV